jgi:tetratricopeptide (TPR) repeat protein
VGRRVRRLLLGVALAAVVLVTYANALRNQFVFDDHLLIVDNRSVRMPLGAGWPDAGYRPLRTLSYRLDYAIGGLDPWIFHLSNVLYHAVTVLLVCAAVRATGASLPAAAAGALVFAVHPVQTEAVAYASGRRDVLCGLLYTAGFLAYLRHRRRGGVPWLVATAGAYALAILAKEMAVTLPLVCLVFDRWSGRRARAGFAREAAAAPAPGRRLWIAGVAAAGGVAFALAYHERLARVLASTPWHGGSAGANFATVARVWAHYALLVLWPARLAADYSHGGFPVSAGLLEPRVAASVALLALVAAAAARSWRAGGLAGLGAAWCAVTLLPVSHVIPYRELLAEHYLYLPMVGVALVVAGLVDALAARLPARRPAIACGVLVVVAALAARTVVRNRDWRDGVSLWSATVAAVPGNVRAHFNLGQARFARGELAEAERAWLAAAALAPEAAATQRALAALYYRLGDSERARARVKAALRRERGDPEALALAGWIALASGRPRRALAYFDAAAARSPGAPAESVRLGRERALLALAPPRPMIAPARPGTPPGGGRGRP